MHVVLKLQTTSERTRRMLIRAGQVVRVGSTEWSDLCISNDSEMAEEHFSLECTNDGCRVKTIGGAVTTVNGEPIEEGDLEHGDQITAGRSEFVVEFSNAADQADDAEDADEPAPAATAGPAAWPNLQSQDVIAICELVTLSEDANSLLAEAPAPDAFAAQLLGSNLAIDALKFVCHALPPRSAVWWALECLESETAIAATPAGEACMAAAKQWCLEPTEEHRRACERVAEGEDSPAAGVAWGAFYSGGSLGPPDIGEIPPAPGMTANTVMAALITAASEAEDLTVAIGQYAQAAAKIAAGGVPWDHQQDLESESST